MGFFDGDHCIFRTRRLKTFDVGREAIECLFEFIGSAMFAFFGALAATDAAAGNGIAIVICIYCVFMVSGGKLNPIVSLVAMLLDLFTNEYRNENVQLLKIVAAKLGGEVASQVAGAIIGTAAARHFAPSTAAAGVGCFYPGDGVTPTTLMALEGAATFTLVLVILSLTTDMVDDNRMSAIAPFAIGGTVYLAASTIGGFTGGCLNPARYAGALYAGECDAARAQTAVFAPAYILGEFFGATAAFVVHMVRVRVKKSFSCGPGGSRAPRPITGGTPAEKSPSTYGDGGDGSFLAGYGARPAFNL